MYKIEATIPTTQYGNIRPVFEVESPEQEEEVLGTLKRLWSRFGETPLKDKQAVDTTATGSVVPVETFTGETVMWDEANHIYRDMKGNVLLSGSKYADQHSPKFDKGIILPKTAKKWGVDEKDLDTIWSWRGDMANTFGSAIHRALELVHKYNHVGKTIQDNEGLEDNYVLPKNAYLRQVVDSFVSQFGTSALPETVVSDVNNGRAGTVDRLEIIDAESKVCRVGDYKTNIELDKKKLLKYQKQLSFYAHILMAHGWTVTGLDIFHLDHNDGWSKIELDVLDLE